jgi:hypothetical protein
MSAPRFARQARELREALLGTAWVQWQALGAQAAAARAPVSVVDPEALILASLGLRHREARLWDFLYGFAGLGPRLLSVQRIQRLAPLYPAEAAAGLAVFARAVTDQAKDPRWRRLAGRAAAPAGRARKLQPPAERFSLPAGLMLRLRSGMGVDVRTDTLTYLLGRGEEWAGVAEIAAALGYGTSSVRSATDALAAARFIETGGTRPQRYYASRQRWGALLGHAALPRWQPWSDTFAFALRLLAWLESDGARAPSDRLALSLARDLLDRHGAMLARLKLDAPDPRGFDQGAEMWAFTKLVEALARWLRREA